MKNQQTKIILIILLVIIKTLSITDEDLFQNYKNTSEPILENTLREKQCIYLQKFFHSFPNETEVVNELPSFFRKIFTNPIINLNSFENWTWVLMREIINQEPDLKEISNYEAYKRITKKLPKQGSLAESKLTNVLRTSNYSINLFKNNHSFFKDSNEDLVFSQFNLLYEGVVKELKDNLSLSANGEDKLQKSVRNIDEETIKLIKIIKEKYFLLKNQVILFEKSKMTVFDHMNALGTKEVLIKDADKFKSISDFIDNLKNYPSPEQEIIINEENKSQNQMNDFYEFFLKAKSFGANFEDPNLKPIFLEVEQKFGDLREVKKIIDQEQIFISYKKLLKEGENEDTTEKEIRRTEFNRNLQIFKNKMENFIPKIKDSILNNQIYIELKNKNSIKYLQGDYNKTLKSLKEIKIKIKNFINEIKNKVFELRRLSLTRKLLEIRIHKKDFVFPNNVFIDLQIELKNVRITQNYLEGISNFDIQNQIININESLNRLEETPENEDNIVFLENTIIKFENYLKINKMQYIIDLLLIRNDINETMSWKFGKIIGRLQNMPNYKKCFSLPNLSLFIFKMMKTNMIHYEKSFLESFLNTYTDFEKQKKFILYNYMISNNREYGLKAIKELEININDKKKKDFIENFTVNFTLLLNIIRNKSTFSRNEISTKIEPIVIAKNIFQMINIDYEKVTSKDNDIQKKAILIILNKINNILLVVLPFLNLIPFIKFFLKHIEYLILKTIFMIIKKLVGGAKGLVKSVLEETITIKDFDFEKLVNNLDEFDSDQDVPNFDVDMGKILNIEENYLAKTEGNNFDFESFDSSDNFISSYHLDVFKLIDQNYLKSHEIPNLYLTKRRII